MMGTVRGRLFLVLVLVLAAMSTGAVAYARTRHHDSGCRGSYTYGSGVAHSGPPCAQTAASYLAQGGTINDCRNHP